MSRAIEDQSLAELLGNLSSSIPDLVRDELELVRAQLRFVLSRLQMASVLLVAAMALVMATAILLVTAAVSGLTIYFIHVGFDAAAAVALAALVVATGAGLIAAMLVVRANGEFHRARAAIDQSKGALAGERSKEHKS
jgi:hypothetical protein